MDFAFKSVQWNSQVSGNYFLHPSSLALIHFCWAAYWRKSKIIKRQRFQPYVLCVSLNTAGLFRPLSPDRFKQKLPFSVWSPHNRIYRPPHTSKTIGLTVFILTKCHLKCIHQIRVLNVQLNFSIVVFKGLYNPP